MPAVSSALIADEWIVPQPTHWCNPDTRGIALRSLSTPFTWWYLHVQKGLRGTWCDQVRPRYISDLESWILCCQTFFFFRRFSIARELGYALPSQICLSSASSPSWRCLWYIENWSEIECLFAVHCYRWLSFKCCSYMGLSSFICTNHCASAYRIWYPSLESCTSTWRLLCASSDAHIGLTR